jgi:hypothetical protein
VVDCMFETLETKNPEHFAVRQYKKYKLAAGVLALRRLVNQTCKKCLINESLYFLRIFKERRQCNEQKNHYCPV